MNVNKFFELAKKANLESCELVISSDRSLDISIFKSEVESYTVADNRVVYARGIFNGKMGFAISEKDDRTTPYYLIDQIVSAAKVSESDDIAIIFEGSEKYKKRNLYNKNLALVTEQEILANLLLIEKKLQNYDKRLHEVQDVSYSQSDTSYELYNSFGLKLKTKDNYFYYVASVLAKDGDDVKSGYEVKLYSDPKELDIDEIVKNAADKALEKLGAKPCASGLYKTLINQKVTASLLGAYLSSAKADNVQKKSSLFVGKLNTSVASSKVTVIDAPLTKNMFYSYFDDEGVAKFNKPVIEKGVLKTYFHNLSTAKKDNVTPTANGSNTGGKIGISVGNLLLKPGRKNKDALLEEIGEGFYLTEVQGLHAGLNPTSGDFSLQASGFMIRNGKIAEPINLVTIAGNLLTLFKNITAVGSDSQLQLSSFITSSIVVKKLAVSGE